MRVEFPKNLPVKLRIVIVTSSLALAMAATQPLSQVAQREARSNPAVIQAAGRGYPWIHLTDGRLLETTCKVDGQELRALRRDDLEPLSLVASDLDEAGTQDLIAGYAT